MPPAAAVRSDDRQGRLPALLLMLTVGTGLLDAVSYLKLGHVFVANMTGNVVFLGFAVAGSSDVSVSVSLLALVAFLAGAMLGGLIGMRSGEQHGRLLGRAVAIETGLVTAALLVAVRHGTSLDGPAQYAVVVLLAVAMGVQNAAARRIGMPDLTTTVLTLTLTGLAADSRWVGGTGPRVSRRLAAVGAMLAGALIGGLLVLRAGLAAALAVAAAFLLTNAVMTRRLASPSTGGR